MADQKRAEELAKALAQRLACMNGAWEVELLAYVSALLAAREALEIVQEDSGRSQYVDIKARAALAALDKVIGGTE